MTVLLFPTKTRLALLRDVADGEVWQHSNGHSVASLAAFSGGTNVVKVTTRIAEAEQAGWVHLYEHTTGARQWKLTDAGRAVLETQREG